MQTLGVGLKDIISLWHFSEFQQNEVQKLLEKKVDIFKWLCYNVIKGNLYYDINRNGGNGYG